MHFQPVICHHYNNCIKVTWQRGATAPGVDPGFWEEGGLNIEVDL